MIVECYIESISDKFVQTDPIIKAKDNEFDKK